MQAQSSGNLEIALHRRNIIPAATVVMGGSGIVAQILLLREFLIISYGSELIIGIVLANWLMLEAAGAFLLGRTMERVRNRVSVFVVFTLLFSLALPAVLYLIRIWKGFIGLMPAEALGPLQTLYSSLILFLPVSLPHGALFVCCCRIYPGVSAGEAEATGKVYFFETLGTIAGGVLFTYLLLALFSPFEVVLALALVNVAVCVLLLQPLRWREQPTGKRVLKVVSVLLTVLCIYALFGSVADGLRRRSIGKQWEPHNVVCYRNSIYGNIVVTEDAEQHTFFFNGVPIGTTPVPDIVSVEELAHFPLLFHPSPEEVLLVSGGAEGLIGEVLKHPTVEEVHYVELDPTLIDVVTRFSPSTREELEDPRVKTEYEDGRFFLKKTTFEYDIILVGLSDPSDLQVNRLFTSDFFDLVRERLKDGGILAVRLPSLPSAILHIRGLRELNSCVLNALEVVFQNIRVIPGDDVNLFLASSSETAVSVDKETIKKRLTERSLTTRLFTPQFIDYRMRPVWLENFQSSLKDGTARINSDLTPLATFYSLIYWSEKFSPTTKKLLEFFGSDISYLLLLPLLLVALFVLLRLSLRVRPSQRIALTFSIATTGFAGMLFDLILIFSFQTFYGYLFYWIGILLSALMGGMALGAIVMTTFLKRIRKHTRLFVRIEASLFILPFILIGSVSALNILSYVGLPPLLFQSLFVFLAVLVGFPVGAEFPLANRVYLDHSQNISRAAGTLYASDLIGGWLGGVASSILLLPLLGLFGACVFLAFLKLSSLTLCLISQR